MIRDILRIYMINSDFKHHSSGINISFKDDIKTCACGQYMSQYNNF